MRSYPRNSPEAAARIVALVLIADGHVCRSEFDVLKQLDAARTLGLAPDGFPQIVQTLCEDLMAGSHSGASLLGGVDDHTLAAWMSEVDDPALQRSVIRISDAAAGADKHIADAESEILALARRHWGMGQGMGTLATRPTLVHARAA